MAAERQMKANGYEKLGIENLEQGEREKDFFLIQKLGEGKEFFQFKNGVFYSNCPSWLQKKNEINRIALSQFHQFVINNSLYERKLIWLTFLNGFLN